MLHRTWARRSLLVVGVVALGCGMAALGWGVDTSAVDAPLAVALGVVLLTAGTLGVVWWWDVNKRARIEDRAPRTVQYVYVPLKVPHSSTVYLPRSNPTEDGRTIQMWSRLRSDDTGDLTRFRR